MTIATSKMAMTTAATTTRTLYIWQWHQHVHDKNNDKWQPFWQNNNSGNGNNESDNNNNNENNSRTKNNYFPFIYLQELALLHHKTRSATVLCKDEVALLAVGREVRYSVYLSSRSLGFAGFSTVSLSHFHTCSLFAFSFPKRKKRVIIK